eukprot:CAMPEP_0114696282 /NCGR_PEP_ID=MMETSP0191-20121206/72374_1 /TAXON_ID=126664 /ORGANISM="Sorites sp." /LENGTH=412 /DNA_ID=CAMNT_0001993713 /DNA_START=45 /DNA_END=1283 /DNA_ORIENTATION=+
MALWRQCLHFLPFLWTESVAANHPLIIVPGLTGSGLEVKEHNAAMPHSWCRRDTKGKWMKVWVSPVQVLPEEIDCLLARLTLTFDPVSDTYSNLPNVELRQLGWANGTAEDASSMDILYEYQFRAILKKLGETQGYELGKDVFIAPYDWRLAGDAHSKRKNGVGGYYPELQLLIEEAVKATTLYFFHKFVSEQWKGEHIHGWVALSSPWMGGANLVESYLGGWTLGMPTWLVPHDYVRAVQVNASSGVMMSPHPKAFGNMPIVQTPSRNYTAADVPELVRIIGKSTWGNQTGALFDKLQGPYAELQSTPSKIHLHNWYSTGVKTGEAFIFDSDLYDGFDKVATKTVWGDGDGLVNLHSLKQVETVWPKDPSTSTRVFPNCSHFGILSDPRVLTALSEYLASAESQNVTTLLV